MKRAKLPVHRSGQSLHILYGARHLTAEPGIDVALLALEYRNGEARRASSHRGA